MALVERLFYFIFVFVLIRVCSSRLSGGGGGGNNDFAHLSLVLVLVLAIHVHIDVLVVIVVVVIVIVVVAFVVVNVINVVVIVVVVIVFVSIGRAVDRLLDLGEYDAGHGRLLVANDRPRVLVAVRDRMGSRHVQLGIGVGAVAVARSPRAEDHVAAVHGALVHLAQVHGAEVDLESALVAERLHAHVALHALLAVGRDEHALLAEVGPALLAAALLACHARVVQAVGGRGTRERAIVVGQNAIFVVVVSVVVGIVGVLVVLVVVVVVAAVH